MSNKLIKSALISFGATIGAGIGAYKAIADKIFNSVFVATSDKTLIYNNIFTDFDNKFIEEENIKDVDWINSSNRINVSVNSIDNFRLNGELFLNNNSDNIIIFVHGYMSNLTDMYMYARKFDELGYDSLLIDLRGHGTSEGEYITFGFKESIDLISWIDFINKNYPNKNIILYGVSMGASTCMMSLIYKLPSNVKCVVEDSGYSDYSQILASNIKRVVKLPLWQLINNEVTRIFKSKTNINLSDVNTKIFLENNEIPILFIHGENDSIVPVSMCKENYFNNKGSKKIYLLKDCKHMQGIENQNYISNINNFIKNNL